MQKKIQVENKHMKNTYLSLGKCKLKKKQKQWTITILSRMAKIQNRNNSKHWLGCESTGTFIYWWGEFIFIHCKMVQSLGKAVWQCIKHIDWYLPKGCEKLCPHKNLHRDVENS